MRGYMTPQVGGTHVMYVLHHADKPQLYHGSLENPTISPTVTFWKGIWKPLAAVGFAVTFLRPVSSTMLVSARTGLKKMWSEDDKPDSTPADTSLPPSEQTTAEHSDDGEMPK